MDFDVFFAVSSAETRETLVILDTIWLQTTVTRKFISNKSIDSNFASKGICGVCFLINKLFYILFIYGFQQSPSVSVFSIKNYFKHFAVYHMLNSQLINVIDKGNKQMA